jgi:nucleoside 2-deoxyribosyltransferase
MPTAYVASPLGFSDATSGFYYDVLLPAVRAAGIEPLDPWGDVAATKQLMEALALPLGEVRRGTLRKINQRLGSSNAQMIEDADGLLAVLDGTDVDSGTAAEVGFAAAKGKPIVGLRLDMRQTGDNEGAMINLQVEHFISGNQGGRVVRSVEEAVEMLARLLGADGDRG